MGHRNYAATVAVARAWELLEEGGFPEHMDDRAPCEIGLSYDQAVLLHIEAAREAHLIKMGKLDKSPKIEKAAKKLAVILASGPKPVAEVRRLAKGISRATLWRARRRLGVRSRKAGYRNGWVWELSRKLKRSSADN